MIWLIEIGLVLLLFGGAWKLLGRGKGNDREAITERRVAAYMATLRRERSAPALSAMTDTELRDVLLSASRNLRIETERKHVILLGLAAVALLAAIVVGNQDGARGFIVALVVGGVVIYGVNEFMSRRIREPLVAQGIDVERLKVQ